MLSIHEMLRRTARDRSDKEAIAWRGRRISFADLDEVSTRIAGFLRANGVERGMRVCVFSAKCPEEVAVIFAIAKAGAVLVHINPTFRDDKLHHVVAECQPAALFFHNGKSAAILRAAQAGILPRLLIRLGTEAGEAIPVSTIGMAAILDEPGRDDASHRVPVGEDDLAAIIYTSGTTASAKGIMVTHGILSDSTLVSAQVLGNVPDDRLISVTPFSFDGALSQLFTATLVGGTLVLQDSHFPKDIVTTLLSERITGCHGVPSFWRLILDRYPALAEHRFPDLRYLSLIGEVFPEPDLLRLKGIFSTADFHMMYGTTEAFRSTALPPADFFRKRGSVGKPLPGVTITIVDGNGTPCPAGTAGEIVHGGAFVSPGYWKRGGTATFRDGRVHTGDLGLLDEEGYLYFVGRKDTMIKRLGFQVYPEEIEACLQSINGVAIAAVVCVPHGGSGPELRAFVVRKPGADLTVDAVLRYCKQKLPHYMVPDDISFRADLPITGTSKIDRAQLRMAGT